MSFRTVFLDQAGVADPIGMALRDYAMAYAFPVMAASVSRPAAAPALGIGAGSCNAAALVDPSRCADPELAIRRCQPFSLRDPASGAVRQLGLVFGNSRLFTGLDQIPLSDPSLQRRTVTARTPSRSGDYEEHAEQVAIRTAEARQLPFWRDENGECHIFCTLAACDRCAAWMTRRQERWVYHVGPFSANWR